jgi:hypothetical protein
MAKVAKQEQENAKVAKVALPAGVKIVNGGETKLDAATIRKLMEGWEVKKIIDEAKARLDAINAELIEAHGTGCTLAVTGICRASLAERESVKIADVERLKAVLGFRFTDLVKTEVSYKPEAKLIEMACDGDEPLQPAIGACLSIGKSESVTWRAER